MKINPAKFWIFIILLFFALAIFIILKIVKVDNSSNISEEKPCITKTNFNLNNHIKTLDSSNIKEEFPYQMYLDSGNYCDISSIHNDLNKLYYINPDAKENQKILVKALTGKLEEKISTSFAVYNPDSLVAILQWVNKFQYYKDIDTNNLKFYRMVHRHWYNFVANKLGEYYERNPDIIYDFKFKYLVGTCQSQNYPPDIRNSNSTKVIDNVVNSKWAYLFKRFWDGTDLLFKLILSAVILFTFYSYYCVYKLKFKRDTK